MLFEKATQQTFILGFDLRDDYCQISYYEDKLQGSVREPSTFSLVPGQERFNIPTALAKEAGGPKWYAGEDAVRMSGEGAIFLPRLLSIAREGSPVNVDGQEVEASALLSLFINRCLGFMSGIMKPEEIEVIMFTSRHMDRRMIEVLESVRERLRLECDIYYEDYANSFYNFLLTQHKVIREPAVILCEYEFGEKMRVGKLSYNLRTRPVVAYYEEKSYPGLFSEDDAGKDAEFLRILHEQMDGGNYSGAFLIGSGFYGGWMHRSIGFLCSGRRAFLGSNLYSKGAAYGALFRVRPPEDADKYFFLDSNKLRANISINLLRRGEIDFHTLVDAGANWYEVRRTEDIILEESNELDLVLSPLTGGTPEEYPIYLTDLPVREGRVTRLQLRFTMTAPDKVLLRIIDLGFGEIFPGTGLKWEKTITIK